MVQNFPREETSVSWGHLVPTLLLIQQCSGEVSKKQQKATRVWRLEALGLPPGRLTARG